MPRRRVGLAGCALFIVAATTGFMALAEPVMAAAYGPGQQLSAQTISDFSNNPGQILTQNPNGGGAMISRLRDLLASDPAALAPILSLIPNANSQQKAAIAAALAQAAKLYARSDLAFAEQIQQAVAGTQDQEVIVAYAAAAGDQPIAAIGTGVSGGGVGGPTGLAGGPGGFGPIQGIGGPGINTGPFSYTGSASTGASSTFATNNNAANSVSP